MSLRPLTWLIALGLAIAIIPVALARAQSLLITGFQSFASIVYPAIATLAMIHLIAYPFLSDKGRANMSQVWMSLFSLGCHAVKGLLNIFISLIKRK